MSGDPPKPLKLAADIIGPIRRSNANELFLVRLVAKPNPENVEAAVNGGAYVYHFHCWPINAPDSDDESI